MSDFNNFDVVKKTKTHIQELFAREGTGHDAWHTLRVYHLAKHIAQTEFKTRTHFLILELGALLHDIADWKFHGGDTQAGPQKAKEYLTALAVDPKTIEAVGALIQGVSFKGAHVKQGELSLETKIVQDADRLDAIGAIGIARCFAYGGAVGQTIYDPRQKPHLHESAEAYLRDRSHSINHFYEKLLLLKDRLHTKTAQDMAQSRQRFMESFLEQFYQEWRWSDERR